MNGGPGLGICVKDLCEDPCSNEDSRRKEESTKQFIKDNTLLRRENAQAQSWHQG